MAKGGKFMVKNASRTIDTKASSKKASDSKKDTKVKKKRVNKSTITEYNSYLFHEGKNYNSYEILGSHMVIENNKHGVRFSTWAPRAKNIWIVCSKNDFKIHDEYKMSKISDGGIWSIFIEGIESGTLYKYAIESEKSEVVFKSDPYAIMSEVRPNTASIVYKKERFKWTDRNWNLRRSRKKIYESPINIYEMHVGSWKRNHGEFLTYDELADELPDYLENMHYTHVEFMPLVEYPLDASWGYQGTGYYSLTSRYGNIEGFKRLVNRLHEKNIGVILDWVPGHFCKNIYGLYMFDGTPTYEYEEFWKADNKGWGTFNFDLGKPEVRSFLISNALYWIKEFHIDGLRVDAVSNILYLNYGRKDGEWIPNKYGGNENIEGVDFLKELNKAVYDEDPQIMMIAEESTTWPNVSKPLSEGGLGFKFKWNMGWMHDSLEYMELSPEEKKNNHNKLNFAMMYQYSENFILSISHDEVVHGKKSLIGKMYGDWWNQFAGVRTYLSYMIGHPGKKLTFMGMEFAQFIEWREYEELEWKLIDEFPMHSMTQKFVRHLNKLYIEKKALWELDDTMDGFKWIDADNNKQSVISFMRMGKKEKDTLIFICNFTPEVYYDFRVGVPYLSDYVEIMNSDNKEYGGSGQVMGDSPLIVQNISSHGQPYSIEVKVPPMGAMIIGLYDGGKC